MDARWTRKAAVCDWTPVVFLISSCLCRIVQVGALGKFSPGVRYAFEVYQVAATAESVTASGS